METNQERYPENNFKLPEIKLATKRARNIKETS